MKTAKLNYCGSHRSRTTLWEGTTPCIGPHDVGLISVTSCDKSRLDVKVPIIFVLPRYLRNTTVPTPSLKSKTATPKTLTMQLFHALVAVFAMLAGIAASDEVGNVYQCTGANYTDWCMLVGEVDICYVWRDTWTWIDSFGPNPGLDCWIYE